MRQSRSFEEAVNAALAERCDGSHKEAKKTKPKKKAKKVKKETIEAIEERYGHGRNPPTGTLTMQRSAGAGQMSGRRGQNPPYSFYSDVASSQVNAELQPPEATEAPKIFPYPLENVTSFLADAFLSIKSIESQIKLAHKNPMVSGAKIKELEAIESVIKTVLGNVKKIGESLQKITLD